MGVNVYNQNFLETPDPATGLQRRTGQNFLDHKQTLHERLVLEHDLDTDAAPPQVDHGTHRAGSAKIYTIAKDDALPDYRPTGKDKSGQNDIPAIALNDADRGRLAYREEDGLYYYKDVTDAWQKIDTTPIGFIQIWPSLTPPPGQWLKCDGASHTHDEYPLLCDILGSTYGGDGINDFNLPDMQGISVVGSGELNYPDNNLPGGTPSGRIKGGGTLGTYVEDQIQTLEGYVAGNGVYAEGNLFDKFSGILKPFMYDLSDKNFPLDRVTGSSNLAPEEGFQIDLTSAGVRHGDETRPTAIVMDYYIKAR